MAHIVTCKEPKSDTLVHFAKKSAFSSLILKGETKTVLTRSVFYSYKQLTGLHVLLELLPPLLHFSEGQREDLLGREGRHHVAAIFLLDLSAQKKKKKGGSRQR